ncbi:MAG: hypothetical protein QOH18_2045, partial [Solirubrobacterales bacterium]|nr:hypothetical protein [Solirubrobacterales bacterium]
RGSPRCHHTDRNARAVCHSFLPPKAHPAAAEPVVAGQGACQVSGRNRPIRCSVRPAPQRGVAKVTDPRALPVFPASICLASISLAPTSLAPTSLPPRGRGDQARGSGLRGSSPDILPERQWARPRRRVWTYIHPYDRKAAIPAFCRIAHPRAHEHAPLIRPVESGVR